MKVSSIEPQKLPAVADRSVFSEITEHCLLYKDLEQPFDERRLPREAEKQFCDCYRYCLDYFLDESKKLEKLIKSELSNKQERGLNMRARWCLDG